MELAEYYQILNPENNSRILVTGRKAIPIALYLAGKAAKEGKNVKTHALISEESEIKDITDEIYIVKEKFPEHLESIEKGLPRTTFEKIDFEKFTNKSKYDYLVYYSKHLEKHDLKRIIQLNTKKILLHIPLSYTMPLEYIKKGIFSKKKEIKTLKQLLISNGSKIEKYEADEKNLIVILKGLKKEFEVKFSDLGKASEKIIKEIEGHIQYTNKGAEFGIRTEDNEFILYIKTKDIANSPYLYNFIFLNGRITTSNGPTKIISKEFDIVVLPNTRVFENELNKKEILIVSKQKAVEIFKEHYSPR